MQDNGLWDDQVYTQTWQRKLVFTFSNYLPPPHPLQLYITKHVTFMNCLQAYYSRLHSGTYHKNTIGPETIPHFCKWRSLWQYQQLTMLQWYLRKNTKTKIIEQYYQRSSLEKFFKIQRCTKYDSNYRGWLVHHSAVRTLDWISSAVEFITTATRSCGVLSCPIYIKQY